MPLGMKHFKEITGTILYLSGNDRCFQSKGDVLISGLPVVIIQPRIEGEKVKWFKWDTIDSINTDLVNLVISGND